MSLQLARAVALSEQNDDFHLGRLLLLLLAANRGKSKTIEGITKLAKLDFLLRYPNCLVRALTAKGYNSDLAKIQPYERTSIESKMIRFRYGPWDSRYRRWIGLLVARGLAITFVKGRTVHVGLTDLGQNLALRLSGSEVFEDVAYRGEIVSKYFGSLSATGLKDFIYEVFPELSDMKWGEEITL